MNRKQNHGFTLLELLITVAIIGIVTSIAVPSFQNNLERNGLKEVVESFKSDLQLARTRAIKQSQNIGINRIEGVGNWCYGLTIKASCTCSVTTTTDAAYCEIKRIVGTNFRPATVVVADAGNSQFDFRRGTIGANGVTFTTTNYSSRVVFSSVGRVRICTPTGTTGLPTYPNC